METPEQKAAQVKYRGTAKFKATRRRYWEGRGKQNYRVLYKFQRMLKEYGITKEQYTELLAQQEGKCSLPSCLNKAECVDHCHEKKKIRSLLCRPCNLALGNFRDNPQLMREAASYIEEHRG